MMKKHTEAEMRLALDRVEPTSDDYLSARYILTDAIAELVGLRDDLPDTEHRRIRHLIEQMEKGQWLNTLSLLQEFSVYVLSKLNDVLKGRVTPANTAPVCTVCSNTTRTGCTFASCNCACHL